MKASVALSMTLSLAVCLSLTGIRPAAATGVCNGSATATLSTPPVLVCDGDCIDEIDACVEARVQVGGDIIASCICDDGTGGYTMVTDCQFVLIYSGAEVSAKLYP